MSETFEPITTQEQFDSMIKERLQRERSSVEKRFEGYISKADHDKAIEDVTKAFEDYKNEHAKDAETIESLTAENKRYATAAVKSRIAHEAGLPYGMATRLSGETEEEIKADAKTLSDMIASGRKAPLPLANTDEPDDDSKTAQYKKLLTGLNLKGD